MDGWMDGSRRGARKYSTTVISKHTKDNGPKQSNSKLITSEEAADLVWPAPDMSILCDETKEMLSVEVSRGPQTSQP